MECVWQRKKCHITEPFNNVYSKSWKKNSTHFLCFSALRPFFFSFFFLYFCLLFDFINFQKATKKAHEKSSYETIEIDLSLVLVVVVMLSFSFYRSLSILCRRKNLLMVRTYYLRSFIVLSSVEYTIWKCIKNAFCAHFFRVTPDIKLRKNISSISMRAHNN